MSIQLSDRTYPLLQTFEDKTSDYHMKIDEAQKIDQRPFRALLVRGYIAFRPGRGFHITRAGRDVAKHFLDEDGTRNRRSENRFNAPLTSYFDPVAYGLTPSSGKKKKATRHTT